MNNRWIVFVVGVLLAAIFSYLISVGFFKEPVSQTPVSTDPRIQVAASFYPLYFFASELGKDKAQVFNVTPAGVEPHEYDPTPQEIARIQKSKLLVANGAGFEPWLDKIRGEQGRVIVIDTSEGANLQESEDPHVWLSPMLAKLQADKILQGYIQADSINRSFYETNAQQLKRRLTQLDDKFKQGLSDCKQRSFITSHAAFGYLAREYNLTQIPISGLSPEEEPSLAKMAEITKFAGENNIKYIFFETLISSKLSETIAGEVGIQTLALDPIEGLSDDDIKQGKNYFTVMETNLKNLQTALECKT